VLAFGGGGGHPSWLIAMRFLPRVLAPDNYRHDQPERANANEDDTVLGD